MNDLTLDILAVHRLTRLVVDDEILDTPRTRLVDWLDDRDHSKLVYLAGCYWCTSVYVAAGCAVVKHRWPNLWNTVRWPLAMSAATGIIASTV